MHIPSLIIKHLLGKLSADEMAALAAWRQESAEHERLFQRLTDSAFLRQEWLKRQAVNPARAAQEMERRIGRKRSLWLRPALWRGVAAAAVVALMMGGAAWMYRSGQQQATIPTEQPMLSLADIKAGGTKATVTLSNGERLSLIESADAASLRQLAQAIPSADKTAEPAAEIQLEVPRGGEFKIVLEDGTEVWLNAQSRLVYPETFSDVERRVSIEGEAYFKVAPDAEKPFYVEAEGQVVRVVGTEFDVHAYADEPLVRTTLVSGQIAMQLADGQGREMLLTPGHQAQLDKAGRSIEVKRVDTEMMTGWKSGTFVFEEQTLAEIMRTLSRWYDFDYRFADQAAAETVFMGRIPRYSNFSDVVQIIEMTGDLSLSLEGRTLSIAKAKKK